MNQCGGVSRGRFSLFRTHKLVVVTRDESALALLPLAGRHAIERQFFAGIQGGNIDYGDVQCIGRHAPTKPIHHHFRTDSHCYRYATNLPGKLSQSVGN